MIRKLRPNGGDALAAACLIWAQATGATIAADNDHDGVDDAIDKCPHTAQVPKAPAGSRYEAVYTDLRRSPGPASYPVDESGCEPDSDGDGVKDSADFCPDDSPETLVAGVAANGCPRQSDGDGTPDYRDRCPDTPRGVAADRFGCPK